MLYATFGSIPFSMNVGGIGEARLWWDWGLGWPGVCNLVGEGASLSGAGVRFVVLPTVCGRNSEIELVLRTDGETGWEGKGKENGKLY